jgi:hypothetical protein
MLNDDVHCSGVESTIRAIFDTAALWMTDLITSSSRPISNLPCHHLRSVVGPYVVRRDL